MTSWEFMKRNPISTIVALCLFVVILFFPIFLVLIFVIPWFWEYIIKGKRDTITVSTTTKSRTTPSNYSTPNLDKWTTERYHTYLQSAQWRNLVAKVKERDKVCQLTGSTQNLEVHHITYDRLGNENLSDLVLLSRKAHQFVHDYYGSYDRYNTYPITEELRTAYKLNLLNNP